MKKVQLFFGIVIFIAACTSKKPTNDLLLPSNIKSQFFEVKSERDTILRTSHNSLFYIRKGTFQSQLPVTVEIKEVLTPDEILRSGLTTTSNGTLLRSAGMLYFNATVNGEQVEPQLPVETTIAASHIDKEMQLFKGEINEDSSVNWVDPQPIDTNKTDDQEHLINSGRILFMTKCASCHNVFKHTTGPALKGVQYRGPWTNPGNLRAWINNPAYFMSQNKYTRDLLGQYKSMMQGFPDISDIDVAALVAYINSATMNESLPFIAAADSSTLKSDCFTYDTSFYELKDTFPEYDTAFYPDVINDTVPLSFYEYDSLYLNSFRQGYRFEITGNGWYNVDAFLKTERNDVQNVKLVADLKMEEDIFMNVYVFVPSERIMQSTFTKKGNQYYFDFENEEIPLPLRYRAVIFAFGSIKDKIVYGISEFTIAKEQTISVEIKQTTKDGLKNILESKNINGISLDAIKKEMNIQKISCSGQDSIINEAKIIRILNK